MSGTRSRGAKSIAAKAAEMSMAVPQVVAHRMARMALAGPAMSERDRREFQLMSAEKTAAFAESWQAMLAQAARSQNALASAWLQALWAPKLQGKGSAAALATQMQHAAMGVLAEGMAPVHRKAVGNARRLAGTRLR